MFKNGVLDQNIALDGRVASGCGNGFFDTMKENGLDTKLVSVSYELTFFRLDITEGSANYGKADTTFGGGTPGVFYNPTNVLGPVRTPQVVGFRIDPVNGKMVGAGHISRTDNFTNDFFVFRTFMY